MGASIGRDSRKAECTPESQILRRSLLSSGVLYLGDELGLAVYRSNGYDGRELIAILELAGYSHGCVCLHSCAEA